MILINSAKLTWTKRETSCMVRVPLSQECFETWTKVSKHACQFLWIVSRLEPTAMGGVMVRL